jgi:hypothetical protein
MYNSDVSQGQNALSWELFLDHAKGKLEKARSKKRRKELQFAVRAFEALIQQKAAMPNPKKSLGATAA